MKSKIILLLSLPLLIYSSVITEGYVAAPFDIIVGIYHPFRDHIWNNFVAGVPFKNSLLSDVISVILPWKELAVDLWLRNIVPLWNPLVGSGLPLAANFQSGVFYPFNLLFLILTKAFSQNGFFFSWNIYTAVSIIMLSAFTFLFLRQKKVGYEGAIFGGVAASLSGQVLGWLEYGNIVHSFLWLPLMLYSVDKVINSSQYRFLPLLSLSIGLSLLAGYPLLSIYSVICVILFSFFAILIDIKFVKRKVSLAALVALFILLGLALSSIQISPSLELLRNSIRENDKFLVSQQNFGFFPIKQSLTIIAPDLFGNPSTNNYFGKNNYNDFAIYVGIITLLLAVVAPIYQREKGVRFFIFLSILSFLLSIENPITKKLIEFNIPLISGAFASRWLFILDFSLCLLGGYGLDVVIKNKNNPNLLRNIIKASLIIFASILLIFYLIFFKSPSLSNTPENFIIAKRNLILPLSFFIFNFFLLTIFIKSKLGSNITRFIPVAIIVLLSLELIRQGTKFNTFSSKAFSYPKTEVTSYLIGNTKYERILGTIPPNITIPYRLYSPEVYEPLLFKRYSQFISIINGEKPETGTKFGIIENYQSKLIDLLGVKYIVYNSEDFRSNFFPTAPDFPISRFSKVFEYGKTSIYLNHKMLPRAFFVGDYITETDPNDIAKNLLSKEFDLKKKVILEEKPDFIPGSCDIPVKINSYTSNKIEISTNSPESCILFLSDNYYPGWSASVDGKRTKIYRADFTFRAVAVPKGIHTIDFEYEPNSYKIGFIMSLISIFVVGTSVLILRKL